MKKKIVFCWMLLLSSLFINNLSSHEYGFPPILDPHIPTSDDIDHKVKQKKKKQPSTRIEEIVFDEDDPRRDLDLA